MAVQQHAHPGREGHRDRALPGPARYREAGQYGDGDRTGEQPGDPDAAALSEDEIADFLCRRIENGELAAEDIPVRLARYGLMQPLAFVEEMRERMASEKGG